MSKQADVDALLERFKAGEDVVEVLQDAIAEGVEDSGKTRYLLVQDVPRQYGTGYNPPTIHRGMYAIVVPGKSIRIVGNYSNTFYDRTYHVGDNAEYASHNYAWFGPIRSISEKAIVVEQEHSKRTKRLDLFRFSWRNYDFDQAKELRRRHEHMD